VLFGPDESYAFASPHHQQSPERGIVALCQDRTLRLWSSRGHGVWYHNFPRIEIHPPPSMLSNLNCEHEQPLSKTLDYSLQAY
jgi:hypothetical protein